MSQKVIKPHPNFIAYQKMIVEHANYRGMPNAHNNDKEITWSAFSGEIKKKRTEWWLSTKKKLLNDGIKLSSRGKFQPTCLYIHPTKKKWIEFKSELPSDFKKMLNLLKKLTS